ncbi:amidohydrolase family protein [Pedobacter hartonius]|uniref:Amidohydrolase family protein n=1 Tax=Pedobacter hartonius TaxID=425514 RepID=A0A1H3VXQ6_9SPHI|nr:amidohydrolase family protein [Pedobacter hartonius]SDZ79530.1 Amidohydrolase family protein [Pedobacter hartonius]
MKYLTIFCLFFGFSSFSQVKKYDLAIKNAKIFNVKTGIVGPAQVILVKNGIIADIIKNTNSFAALKTIDAQGKLVTPSFIDAHIHPTDVFGDYDKAPEYLVKDSLHIYRQRLTDAYLPYGITTVMIMGQPEKWQTPLLQWSINPLPNHINIYTAGAAIISKEDRPTYIGHVVVDSPLAAKKKIEAYYQLGIRHIKLYWRLRDPEFKIAFKTADSLGMRVYGHIDQNVMTMDQTLDIGLKNYEHLVTIAYSVIKEKKDWDAFNTEFTEHYREVKTQSDILKMFLEMFRYIDEHKKTETNILIDKLASQNATFSTSINILAELFQSGSPGDAVSLVRQQARTKQNFETFMKYVKQMQEKGIKLRIGTDMANGGKSLQGEQLLLFKSGFSISSILQICTINGAQALGIDSKVGIIKKGRQADLLIWHRSPFNSANNLLSDRIIIKDGIVYQRTID